ncbi:MAG: hypothetical protein ACI9XK_003092 [Granulosicoccus sp.]
MLDGDVEAFDVELSAIDNFDHATLTLIRNDGANGDDQYTAAAAGTLGALVEGSNLTVSATTIGTVTTNTAG